MFAYHVKYIHYFFYNWYNTELVNEVNASTIVSIFNFIQKQS